MTNIRGLTCDRTASIIICDRSVAFFFGGVYMAKDTKERILAAALEMFSKNGYAGTNIRELAASLGMGKSSMYRHFESKEEIWNALLDEMIAYYAERFGSSEHLPPAPDSLEGLVLKFYNGELEYVCEPGEFEVMIGTNSADVQSAKFALK